MFRAEVSVVTHRGPFIQSLHDSIYHSMDESLSAYKSDMYQTLRQKIGEPSLPGEPPAYITGALAESLLHFIDIDKIGMISGGVGVRRDQRAKAYFLEFGTRKMAPRPAWRPTLEENWERYRQILAGRSGN